MHLKSFCCFNVRFEEYLFLCFVLFPFLEALSSSLLLPVVFLKQPPLHPGLPHLHPIYATVSFSDLFSGVCKTHKIGECKPQKSGGGNSNRNRKVYGTKGVQRKYIPAR